MKEKRSTKMIMATKSSKTMRKETLIWALKLLISIFKAFEAIYILFNNKQKSET